ncbi:uncharacterized protein METZ01_LOCUS312775, partial [marine metagenome]
VPLTWYIGFFAIVKDASENKCQTYKYYAGDDRNLFHHITFLLAYSPPLTSPTAGS